MSSAKNNANDDVKLSLKVMMDKEKGKVLFAVADNHFVDILLSFLTLPLGRIIKVLQNHYGEKPPTIGSLNSLYHSLANLDTAHFVTKAAKETLLNPPSSFEVENRMLKLDITYSPPVEYFSSSSTYYCDHDISYHSYYDNCPTTCITCTSPVRKEVDKTASSDGVLTIHKAFFTISDDLQIFPNEIGILQIMSLLGITDLHKAEEIQVAFGLNEIMDLLKASLTSPTPLSDVVLNKITLVKSASVPLHDTSSKEDNPNSKNLCLKLTTQKSTGKVLYAQAKEDFVEFLFVFFHIPLGGVAHLVAGKTRAKAINNLYRSIAELVNDEYFKTRDMKKRLMNPNLYHGCISKNHILPLVEESLPANYTDNIIKFSPDTFPKGQGKYLNGPQTYRIGDDLTVTPFCNASILSTLNSLKIPISDVQEKELQIGLKEALRILNASLTSTSALTDALLTQKSIKRPKIEV